MKQQTILHYNTAPIGRGNPLHYVQGWFRNSKGTYVALTMTRSGSFEHDITADSWRDKQPIAEAIAAERNQLLRREAEAASGKKS